ncbi:hypothetical protein NDU88_006311 [Pleurodeles waltl]|uniref:Uncharacterized protein n=1 Tax=Pleurodeles waltl TaxID=8319 RepID=A0AAV7NPU9_PLEWA|nr:hypothetical protein NDU88_006311 [Pleurodeles waltl]
MVKLKRVLNEAPGLRSHWQHLRPSCQATRRPRGLCSNRPHPGRSQLFRASGHRWASAEPTPSERGSRGADISVSASAQKAIDGTNLHQRASDSGRGTATAQPRSGAAAPEGSEMLSPASAAIHEAGASPLQSPVRARLRHSAPSPRRRPAAPGGVRAGRSRSRGPGSTAASSQYTERPHRPMCSRG